MSVRPFDSSLDLDDAAAILAARHRGDRLRFPILPASFEDESVVRQSLQETASFATGVAATGTEGRLTGFLLGIRRLPSPGDLDARFTTPRSTMMFAHGHAVSEKFDSFAAYHALYTELAQDWVRDGFFDHVVHVPAGRSEQPWFELGFGRHFAVAARGLQLLSGEVTSRIEVRLAGAEDVDCVMELSSSGSSFHASSPIFMPDMHRDTDRAFKEELARALVDEKQAVLLAHEKGQSVGMLRIAPARGSAMFLPDKSANIGDTAVVEQSRRLGVGSALLRASIAWARNNGYEHLTLRFHTANAQARSFWTGHGFEPVMYHLSRHIDERILWAREDSVG